MRFLILITLGLFLVGCADQNSVQGKWYTYSESGDYMELWIAEDKALTYLSSIDEFLLYDLGQEGGVLDFSLIESRITDEHQFKLELIKVENELFQATFIGADRIDSLKTYFLVSKDIPQLAGSLSENRIQMEELLSRLEGSHEGHGH